MNRWTRANLLLFLFGLVLLGLTYWPDRPADGPRLTTLDPATISTVRVERDDRLTLALQRNGDGWQITYPIEGAANAQRVTRLLAIAGAPVQHQFAAVDANPDRYGLGDAATVIQFDDQRLAFGDRDPTQRSRYIRVGDRIAVIDELFYSLLTLPVSHYSEP